METANNAPLIRVNLHDDMIITLNDKEDATFPLNSFPEDRTLPGFCREALSNLMDSDPSIDLALKAVERAREIIKTQSTQLWKQLKDYRIEIATRYNAIF